MANSNTFILLILWMIIIMIGTSNTVQGSHRDLSRQNKDLAMLTQYSSNNLNNPSSLSGSKSYGSASDVDVNRSGPYFDVAASKNVTALLGKTAYLNCRVKNLGNKTMLLQVSWVRHRDIHLLTVGRYTYTSDQRFKAIHHPHSEDWMLQIKYPQHRDSGIYECQISTTPHMSHFIYLSVIEPSTEIIGAPDLYIESGSTINLTCVVHNSPEPPAFIFWNHNNAIISYDSARGGISVITEKGETSTSFLLIQNARPSDSGQYQCNPSNAKSRSVTVHVLNGASHSVSRGVPSSNAARGAIASSNVAATLSLHLYISIMFHVFLYQNIHKRLIQIGGDLCTSINNVLLHTHINFYWKSTRYFLIWKRTTIMEERSKSSQIFRYNMFTYNNNNYGNTKCIEMSPLNIKNRKTHSIHNTFKTNYDIR
ncbi:CLUMA_CG018217, isoform A [Clunio marinus]|uniref:CLUMA_CG018217, isoform A n=1 Tax=Clunio marinus TaxID=568069 RepID=A0A1J1IZE9_9DIPT|nr:CLUMA_CG018217, isoform A [Clunio marinus]